MAEIINLLEYRRQKEEIELKRLKSEVEHLVSKYPVLPEPYVYHSDSDTDVLTLFENLSVNWGLGRSYYDYDERDYSCEYEYTDPGLGDES